MIFVKLGFKNLARNKRRTILAGLAVGLGLASLILADGIWKGMIENMVTNVTSTYIGDAQVHHSKFGESYEAQYILKDPQVLEEKILNYNFVTALTERVLAIGMISSSGDSLNANIVGIDPINESEISRFHERIVEGDYLRSEKDIMIGKRLQKKLDVELGDRLVVTVSEVKTGKIKQVLFRLSGIFGMGSKEIDEEMALIHFKSLQSLLGIKGIHEIAIRFHKPSDADTYLNVLKSLEDKDTKVETWKELVPQVVAAMGMTQISINILGLILSLLVSLGILNTLFMSLYERTYEFGVIRALGTKDHELLLMIASEAFGLGVISNLFGFFISAIIGGYWMKYGIDYSGIEFGEVTFTDKIYFVFSANQISVYPLIVLIFVILISLYPAWKTLKIKPASALRRSM